MHLKAIVMSSTDVRLWFGDVLDAWADDVLRFSSSELETVDDALDAFLEYFSEEFENLLAEEGVDELVVFIGFAEAYEVGDFEALLNIIEEKVYHKDVRDIVKEVLQELGLISSEKGEYELDVGERYLKYRLGKALSERYFRRRRKKNRRIRL